MRINLCRRQIAVTEQHLHDAQISAIVQQVRGKRVTQRVRRQLTRNFCLLRVALDDVPESLASHAVTTTGRKQVFGLSFEQDFDTRTGKKFTQPVLRFITSTQ